MCKNTSLIKVQVLDSKDGDYRGISFYGINPEPDKYFHCNSIESAYELKNMIDDFVDEQIMNICSSPWECSNRLSMTQIQQDRNVHPK